MNKSTPKILIVDDTPANLVALKLLLKEVDVDFIKANSGADALALISECDFVLIFMADHMSDKYGYEVAQILSPTKGTKTIPVIFIIDAYEDDANLLKSYPVGAVDFIQKPIEKSILFSKVNVFLELFLQRKKLEVKINNLELLVQERTKESEQAVQLDALTQLPNRYLFQTRLEIAFSTSHRVGSKVDLMLIDLDHFKDINDTLGHPIGDMLLVQVAKRLTDCVRDSDTVARLGGDEFAIIAINDNNGSSITPLVRRCLKALSTPFKLDVHTVHTAGSIGIATFPDDAKHHDRVLKCADLALYQSKNAGRGTYHFYNKKMNEAARLRVQEEAELKLAIAQMQLELYYQPQIDLHSRKVIGMEALIRWNHPEKGLVYPMDFIPLAEETGLIVPLGKMIFELAVDQVDEWRQSGITDLKLAVNLSVKQMHDNNFLPMIDKILSNLGVEDINTIELEVTETLILEESESMSDLMQQLKSRDISLAIDDFGTGFSSMSHLKKIPAKFLKIDRMFVTNIIEDPIDAKIFKAIVNLAHALDMLVIAEGVETKEQLDYVAEHSCDIAQGYYYSYPLPADKFVAWLKNYNAQL